MKTTIMPVVPLRGIAVFPYMVLNFDVGRERSKNALERSMVNNQLLFVTAQKDLEVESATLDDLYDVGTVVRVKQVLVLPGDMVRVLVEGMSRARIVGVTSEDAYMEGVLEEPLEPEENPDTLEAYMRVLAKAFEKYARLSRKIPPDTVSSLESVTNPGQLADTIAANVLMKLEDKQAVLSCFSAVERLEKLLGILKRETDVMELERRVGIRVKKQMDRSQREYYLREQMKAIQKELGERDNDTEELRKKLEKVPLDEESRTKVMKELDRLAHMPPGTPEIPVIRTYLEWILELPYGVYTKDNMNLKNARRILDEDHYGLEKVKERIIEYLAVCRLTENLNGPILCFVGPPGVGKTSIAKSIARALDRKFVRMSLGGVRDEAEIRGHRRTYIGAIPGRVVSSIRQAGSMNPVFLFDEIDKMASDFRGDPASAMLEVLDPEQNSTFRDHYMDIPFDLSKVLFVTTANSADTIPRPLLDRMELIELGGYTEDEKVEIAARHLVPKEEERHGIGPDSLAIPKPAIRRIIGDYTREAGVRNLERQIAAVCRKAAVEIVENPEEKIRVSQGKIREYLGVPRFSKDDLDKKDEVGVANGLAWTAVGGVTLLVEVTRMKGSGKLVLTGQLGDVMQESARAGMSLIRSRALRWGIDEDFHEHTDLHIHVPEGATPKDGPSAGITMVTAMVSALTGIPVKGSVAMTGEITLQGRVLPIGGLKEKTLAAVRAGIREILIPWENQKDLEEIPENVKDKIKIVPVKDIESVLRHALTKTPKPRKEEVHGD